MENRPLGRVIDNHEYQLLAEMSIDGFACITVESEEHWKAPPTPHHGSTWDGSLEKEKSILGAA